MNDATNTIIDTRRHWKTFVAPAGKKMTSRRLSLACAQAASNTVRVRRVNALLKPQPMRKGMFDGR